MADGNSPAINPIPPASQELAQVEQITYPEIIISQGTTPAAVDHIQRNTTLLTNAIYSRMSQVQLGQKIVVGLGELHENGEHVAIQTNTVHELTQKGVKVAVALEWPPNNIDLHSDEIFMPSTTNKEGVKALLAAPGNETLRDRLSADTTPIRTSNARLSRAILHQYMDNHGIQVFCADTPRNWESYIINGRTVQHLLNSDPKAQEALLDANKVLFEGLSDVPPQDIEIDSLAPYGMLARNYYMKNRAQDILAAHPEIDVLFIEAGRAHVTGNEALIKGPSPFNHSLTWIFSGQTHLAFIAAPLYTSEDDKTQNTPPEALKDEHLVTMSLTDNPTFNTSSDTTSDLREAAYIESIAPYFSYITDTLNGRSPQELFQARSETLRIALRDLRDNNGLLLAAPVDEMMPN